MHRPIDFKMHRPIASSDRLQNAAEYYRCSANSLIKFSAKVWSSKYLFPFEKNALYRLTFKCIRDKQSRWLDGIEFSPTCSYCDEEFETTQHLLFECKKLENFRSLLALNCWTDIFESKDLIILRFTSSILLGSLKNTPTDSVNYLNMLLRL